MYTPNHSNEVKVPASLSRSLSSPSSPSSPIKPASNTSQEAPPQHTTHVVEVRSADVERGLNELLAKVELQKTNENLRRFHNYGEGPEGPYKAESAFTFKHY